MFEGDVIVGVPVQLRGAIDEHLADRVVDDLRGTAGPVILGIDSPGGCGLSARRICRATARHGDVHGEIDHNAEAISGGALCWLACRTRSMAFGASVRLHYSSIPNFFLAYADAETLRRIADDLDTFDRWVRDLVVSQTALDDERADELLLADRRLGRDEARRLGLWG